jgi:predicted dehydrogenase
MSAPVSISIAGAGLIGRRHAAAIAACPEARLHSIVDPSDRARSYAAAISSPWFPSLAALFDAGLPDGVIVATPNAVHAENGAECVAAAVPALIEKPLASDLASARDLVAAGERAGVALMVGHHRRHNRLIQAAKVQIENGSLGAIAAVHGMFWVMKPDDYFDTDWRRRTGGGPILINLVHDIDLLRYLVGDILSVQALRSSAMRGHPVEDTAAVLLRFDNGALGSFSLSDTIVAPWSWELTAQENPAYPATGQSCYFIGGNQASMELPSGRIWRHAGQRSWLQPISAEHHPVERQDPLVAQIAQFARVIRGVEAPLAPAREGLRTLEVIDAIARSADTGQAVAL